MSQTEKRAFSTGFLRRSFSFCLLLLTLIGCGKEAKNGDPDDGTTEVDPVVREIEALLAHQSVECDRGLACPPSIAKVVVVNRGQLKFCTGFLVSSKAVATSASCLNEGLRLSTDPRRCQRDVHMFFAKSGFQEEMRVGCSKILLALPLVGRDPALWRNDLVYLELDRPVHRMRMTLSRQGVSEDETFTMWKVDAENDQLGVIRKETCSPVLGGYVNPLSDARFSPNLVLAGCRFQEGNQGAPLVGRDRRVWYGLVSQGIDARLANFINQSGRLLQPLEPIIHASNAACLPSVIESDAVTERDCFRDLEYSQLDRRRAQQLEGPLLHRPNLERLAEQAAPQLRSYFKWSAELGENSLEGHPVKWVPTCLRPIRDWVSRVGTRQSFTYSAELPAWKLDLAFSPRGKLVSRLTEAPARRLVVEFSPRSVRANGRTDVSVTMGGRTVVYANLTESCPK